MSAPGRRLLAAVGGLGAIQQRPDFDRPIANVASDLANSGVVSVEARVQLQHATAAASGGGVI